MPKRDGNKEQGIFTKGCKLASDLFQLDLAEEREKREKKLDEEKKELDEELEEKKENFEQIRKKYPSEHPKYQRSKQRYELALRDHDREMESLEEDEFKSSIKFAQIDAEPVEVRYFAYLIGLVVMFASLGGSLITIFFTNIPFIFKLITLFPIFILPLIAIAVVMNFPYYLAERRRAKTIGRMPEAINYMVMAMSITPNLGRAVKYAAESVEEPLSSEMRKIIWDVEMRRYSKIEESLLAFADEWGKWSEEFRRSLYTIRNASHKETQEEINRSLDKANQIAVNGAEKKMRSFAEALTIPAMTLFSLGSILPLLIAALLPVLAVGEATADLIIIFLDVIIPIGFFIYSSHILGYRPAIRVSLSIPSFLTKKEMYTIVGTSIGIAAGMIFLGFYLRPHYSYLISLLPLWGITIGITIYCFFTSYLPYKERNNIIETEKNFPNALFHLGGYIGRGEPPERALEKVADNIHSASVSVLFQKISYSLHVTRKSLSDILFGKGGVLEDHPSQMIKATTTTITRAIKKDPVTAGQSLARISDYLNQLMDIEEEMKSRLKEITGMMTVTAQFIAPLVMGVTTVLYVILAGYFAEIDLSGPLSDVAGGFVGGEIPIGGFVFCLVVGIYLILLVLLTVYFTVGIESGEDWTARKMTITKVLPISILLFTLSAIFAEMFLSGIV